MNPFNSLTLAQIVTGNHRAASVFEKYHLDFCCRGKRSLEQACQEQQLPIDQLIDELLTAIEDHHHHAFPCDALSLEKLCAHIVSHHHAYTKQELPQLCLYTQKVALKHGQRHPELARLFENIALLREEMEVHMLKEEEVLFPRIIDLERTASGQPREYQANVSYLQDPIMMIEQEHDQAGKIMAGIRQLTSDYKVPNDACTTYRLLYASLQAFEMNMHQHVHLENNILFPKATALATELAKAALN